MSAPRSPLEPEPAAGPTPAPSAASPRFADLRELGAAGLLGLAWALLPGLLGVTLLASIGPVSAWLHGLGVWGWPVYAGAFAASAGLGLLPTYAQAILGGWVFGFARGFPAALLGFTLAAFVGFHLARHIAGDSVERLLSKDPRLLVVRDALVRERHGRTLLVTALLRVPPTSPFSLMNLAFASSKVAQWPFLLGTTLGLAPRTVVYVWMGAAGKRSGAAGLDELVARKNGLLQLGIGIALTVGIFWLLNRWAHAALRRTLAQPGAEAGGLG